MASAKARADPCSSRQSLGRRLTAVSRPRPIMSTTYCIVSPKQPSTPPEPPKIAPHHTHLTLPAPCLTCSQNHRSCASARRSCGASGAQSSYTDSVHHRPGVRPPAASSRSVSHSNPECLDGSPYPSLAAVDRPPPHPRCPRKTSRRNTAKKGRGPAHAMPPARVILSRFSVPPGRTHPSKLTPG